MYLAMEYEYQALLSSHCITDSSCKALGTFGKEGIPDEFRVRVVSLMEGFILTPFWIRWKG